MRIIRWLLLLIILILAIGFGLINGDKVSFHYYLGSIDIPLSYLIFVGLLLGILIGWLVSFSALTRVRFQLWRTKQMLKHYELALQTQKNLSLKDD